MRKLLLLLGVLSFTLSTNAQIQFEQNFNYSAAQTILENDGQKYYLMDVPAEQCRIYNSDYTLWKTIQFDIPNNQYLSDIKFVSQNVFNSDNEVEMVITYYKYFETATSYYYRYTTEVIGENGQILLSVPGGAFADIHSDKDSVSRLFIYTYDYSEWPYDVETKIYTIPGQLLSSEGYLREDQSNVSQQFGVFPNPNNGVMTLRRSHDVVSEASRLIIRDVQGKEVYNLMLQTNQPITQMELLGLDPGTYFYEVSTPFLKLKPKKMVITK